MPNVVSPAGRPLIVPMGQAAKITDEIAISVAKNVIRGVPLRHALYLETPVIPMEHWINSLQKSPRLSAIYGKTIAEGIRDMMDEISAADCLRKLPPAVWKLERVFPQDYNPNTKATHVTNNLTLIGVSNDIAQRAAELVRRKTPEELALASGRAENIKCVRAKRAKAVATQLHDIDVQAQVTPAPSPGDGSTNR